MFTFLPSDEQHSMFSGRRHELGRSMISNRYNKNLYSCYSYYDWWKNPLFFYGCPLVKKKFLLLVVLPSWLHL